MRILIAGSSGLIGSALCEHLTDEGHDVVRLVRREQGEHEIHWDPQAGVLAADDLQGFEAVVHLGGRSIAAGRWTKKIKRELIESRVRTTELLAGRLAELANPPKVLICASAIGIYGDRGVEELHEESGVGTGFLAELGQAWEGASALAETVGIRVVQARFGIVLSRRGGALAKMLPPFRLGLGGRIGDGWQYFSWIALDDVLAAISHVLAEDVLRGPVNFAAPQPVTNAEFTKSLGSVLRRPTIFPLPAFAAKLVLGELAKEGLLASQRVVPKALLSAGFAFEYADLSGALRQALKE